MKVAIVLNSPSINREIEEDVVIAADAGYLHAKNQRKNTCFSVPSYRGWGNSYLT